MQFAQGVGEVGFGVGGFSAGDLCCNKELVPWDVGFFYCCSQLGFVAIYCEGKSEELWTWWRKRKETTFGAVEVVEASFHGHYDCLDEFFVLNVSACSRYYSSCSDAESKLGNVSIVQTNTLIDGGYHRYLMAVIESQILDIGHLLGGNSQVALCPERWAI